jgi:hypothetical protein
MVVEEVVLMWCDRTRDCHPVAAASFSTLSRERLHEEQDGDDDSVSFAGRSAPSSSIFRIKQFY